MSRAKRKTVIYVFVLPPLILYLLFFLTPFIMGLLLPLAKYDALTRPPAGCDSFAPKPASCDSLAPPPAALTRLPAALLPVSLPNTLLTKMASEMVEGGPFARIFCACIYPSAHIKYKYKASSCLPMSIPRNELTREVLKRCSSANERALMNSAYSLQKDAYVLDSAFDSRNITAPLYCMSAIEDGSLDKELIATLVSELEAVAIEGNGTAAAADKFIADNTLQGAPAVAVTKAAQGINDVGKVMKLLADVWVSASFSITATGRTLLFIVFFCFGNSALAIISSKCDTKLEGQDVFRFMFFLPNMLSLTIASLIWSILFERLLPIVMG